MLQSPTAEPKAIDIFDWIKSKGGDKCFASYSGGEDEGFVEGVQIRKGNDLVCMLEHTGYELTFFDGKWMRKNPTQDDIMIDLVCEPIFNRYGSFAFEGYVDGYVLWDAETRRMVLNGKETETVWNQISEEEEF